MKLDAIGIYEIHDLKISRMTDAGSQVSLLNIFEKKLFPVLKAFDLTQSKTIHLIFENEHYYCKRLMPSDILIVIITRNILQFEDEKKNTELYYLFTNVKNAYLNQKTSGVTLKSIIGCPLNYIAKDCFADKLHDDLNKTKEIVVQAYEKVIERGERLIPLLEGAIKLEQSAKGLKEEAKKLNSCCYFF